MDTALLVKAVGDAASRSRWLMLLLVSSSVFILAAHWNTWDTGWIHSRVAKASLIRDCYAGTSKCAAPEREAYKAFLGRYGIAEPVPGNVDSFKDLNKYLDSQRQLIQEKVAVVQVPVFGFLLDVNDLGVYAGILFVVILGMLRYSMQRELDNIRFALESTPGEKEYRELYGILSTTQVFSTPHPYSAILSRFHWLNLWQLLPQIPMGLPVAVYGLVVYHDAVSARIGAAVSSTGVARVLGAEVLLCIAVVTLAATCVTMFWRIDNLWAAKRPGAPAQPAPA